MSYGVGHWCSLDPVLLWPWCRLELQLQFTPSLATSICHRCGPKKIKLKKKKDIYCAKVLCFEVMHSKACHNPPWTPLIFSYLAKYFWSLILECMFRKRGTESLNTSPSLISASSCCSLPEWEKLDIFFPFCHILSYASLPCSTPKFLFWILILQYDGIWMACSN